MAKLSDKDELKLIADWKTGAYSQRDLSGTQYKRKLNANV